MSESSNIYNHNSSVRDIAKLFPEVKRLGTKASDLVSGIALTACLDIDEAFDVLGTPPGPGSADRAAHIVGCHGINKLNKFTSDEHLACSA